MKLDEFVIKLEQNGFKVIDKGENLRLIKNRKAIDYSKKEFLELNEENKLKELKTIILVFDKGI